MFCLQIWYSHLQMFAASGFFGSEKFILWVLLAIWGTIVGVTLWTNRVMVAKLCKAFSKIIFSAETAGALLALLFINSFRDRK